MSRAEREEMLIALSNGTFKPDWGTPPGTTTPAAKLSFDKARELCKKGETKAALAPVMHALNNTSDIADLDIVVQLALLGEKEDPETALAMVEAAEKRGREILHNAYGSRYFEEGPHVAHMWGILCMQSLMSVRQHVINFYFKAGRFEECLELSFDQICICGREFINTRLNNKYTWTMGSFLIHLGRYSDALSFAQEWIAYWIQYPGSVDAADRDFDDTEVTPPLGLPPFSKPTKDVVSRKKEVFLSKYGWASVMYSAALASFKLFGDTLQARQYLRIAARLKPMVSIKLLMWARHPGDIRLTTESSAATTDYLHWIQDIWTQDDVQGWLCSNEEITEFLLLPCSSPDCKAKETSFAEFKLCSSCLTARYCSRECQKIHWSEHKNQCAFMKSVKKLGQLKKRC